MGWRYLPVGCLSLRRSRLAARVFGLTTWASVLGLVASCSPSDPPNGCVPKDARTCSCPDGSAGLSRCADDGSNYGACVCGNTDGGRSDGGVDPSYLKPCTSNGDCGSLTCFAYDRGQYCSKSCSVDADCPPPSKGCNQKGQCKYQ